jgi:N-acetylglucosamine malate deacetylase 2
VLKFLRVEPGSMNLAGKQFGRVLVLAAHPDDETIACSGLLQRAASSLVVFAVDGAPPHYGFEKKFGSLQNYSETRFREASGALDLIPSCELRRLSRADGSYFVDQHLFQELPEALASLRRIVREFSPELLISHAFEGGHIDHDACHILARRVAQAANLSALEFPMYWKSENGADVFQQFRAGGSGEVVLELTKEEIRCKQEMLAQYQTQRALLSYFGLEMERFRPMSEEENAKPEWPGYPFENGKQYLKTDALLQKISELPGPAFVSPHALG